MPKVWVKIPRITHPCDCGCGVMVTGTARKMYAKPYCKLKMHLRRKGKLRQPNPLNNVLPFTLGEANEDMSSTV